MRELIRLIGHVMLLLLAFVTGASGQVMMAEATDLPDAGNTTGGAAATDATAGIATETQGRDEGDEDFYMNEIDKRVTKIRPMSTPVDQISRYAKSSKSGSFIVKYYSIGTRPTSCVTNADLEEMTTGASVPLPVDDVNMFTLDDTIRVVGVSAVTNSKNAEYTDSDTGVPDLVLWVCGKDSSNLPLVCAVNGSLDSSGQPILIPAIPSGTTLIRMGKACGELDVQTGRFNNLPTAQEQYCQNFMMQIEQSTFDKLAKKEVNWNFSDMEEAAIYEMRIGMENTFLFGDRRCIQHSAKEGMNTWFTGGIYWMAGKDLDIGSLDDDGEPVITDDDLVDFARELFVGTGVGNKRKLLFCGSELMAAFSKIKSEKYRLKDNVEIWNLKFKSWDTDFGEILTVYHELFDENGMSDQGFVLDPEYLAKKTHVSWGRNVLDLKKAGIRRTDAVVLQEVSCLYLRYAKAHARVQLVQASTSEEEETTETTE